MAKTILTNINIIKNTCVLDKLYSNLSGNIFLEFFNDQIFISMENMNIFKNTNNKLRSILDLQSHKFETKLVNIFNTININKDLYFKLESPFNITNSVYVNDDKIFNLSKNLKCFAPLWVDKNNIPDFFIITKKTSNFDKYGEIKYVLDLRKNNLKPYLKTYLEKFTQPKISKSNFQITDQYFYELNGLNINTGLETTINFKSEIDGFEKTNKSQLEIFNNFGDNQVIIPNIFNFVFNFNDETFNNDIHLYESFYYNIIDEDEITIDKDNFIKEFNLPFDIFDKKIENLNISNKKMVNVIKTKNDLLITSHPKIKNFIQTKSKIYQILDKKIPNGYENTFSILTNNINLNDLFGTESYSSIANPVVFKDNMYSNLKLSLFNNGNPNIFNRSDYISFKCELLRNDKDLKNDLIEWRLYASDTPQCNCVKNKNGCFQPGFLSNFSSSLITNERNSLEIIVNDYIELEEGSQIFYEITNSKFNGNAKIYKIRNNFHKKETRFNLYLDENIIDEYKGQNINFQYYQSPFYYTFFDKNGNPSDIVKNIQKAIFQSFIHKTFPIDAIVENNNIIFMNKFPGNKFQKLYFNYRFRSKTNLNNFIINDLYKLKSKNIDFTTFQFGTVEFTGGFENKNSICFLLKKSDVIDINYDYILTNKGNYNINKWKFEDSFINHYNYIIDDELIDNYWGYCVENEFENNTIYTKDNMIFLTKDFIPKILQMQEL